MKENTTSLNGELISFVETPPEISELMIKIISKPKESVILDTGFGNGIFLEKLSQSAFHDIEGIEINKELYSKVKRNFPNKNLDNDDFITWKSPKKYDIIIGNPPYLHFNSLPSEMQKRVRKLTKTGESDIYYAFIIKAIDLLKENGELIYIVPYGFLYNTHAETVRRQIVTNGFIDLIIDLDEVKLFMGENPETIIFRYQKNSAKSSKKMEILRIKTKKANTNEILSKALKSLNEKKSNELFEYFQRDIFTDPNESWSSYPQIKIPEYQFLKELAYVGVGFVSGFDLAFRIEEEEEFSHFNNNEKRLIKKFIKAINCKSFWTEGFVEYIVIGDQINAEERLKSNYPNVYERVKKYKKRMNNRYLPNKKWFQWMALRNQKTVNNLMDLPKIFIPTLDRSKKNRFSISYDRVYPSGDTLVIISQKVSSLFLLGYLNSDFFRNYYLSYGARKGHRIAFTQRILANIKIPMFKKEIIEEIEEVTKSILQKKDDSRRQDVDKIIIHAFENNLFQEGRYRKSLSTKQTELTSFLS